MPGQTQQLAFQVDTSGSAPLGKYPVQISATDGFVAVEVNTTVTIGDFSLAVIPAVIPAGPNGTTGTPRVGPSSSNGLSEAITLACAGLPVGTTCSPGLLLADQPNTTVAIDYASLPVGDYPFQVIGNIGGDYHQASAVLQVGDFSATLNKSSVALSLGGSAAFDISLTSINHYATSISVYCQVPDNRLTCAPVQPVVLTDGLHGVVQLTVSASTSVAAAMPSHQADYALLGIVLLSLIAVPRKRSVSLNCAIMALALSACISCGGGSSSGGNGSSGPGSGGGGTPTGKIIKVPVVVQYLSESNSINQKDAGPHRDHPTIGPPRVVGTGAIMLFNRSSETRSVDLPCNGKLRIRTGDPGFAPRSTKLLSYRLVHRNIGDRPKTFRNGFPRAALDYRPGSGWGIPHGKVRFAVAIVISGYRHISFLP